MMSELENRLRKVTWLLWEMDREIKTLEAQKKTLREEFFDLATEWVMDNDRLNRKTVYTSGETEFSLDNYPGYRLVTSSVKDGVTTTVIEEDPSLLKFTYVNPDNHYVFSRIIATVGEKFDSDRFVVEHPELAENCIERKMVFILNEKEAERLARNNPELLPLFQDYTIPGKPQVRLGSPRKATEEDYG